MMKLSALASHLLARITLTLMSYFAIPVVFKNSIFRNLTMYLCKLWVAICVLVCVMWVIRARLHDTWSELKLVWNLKPFWNIVPFTWQFTWRFHCRNFPNNSKALLHTCKWYLLINANLINVSCKLNQCKADALLVVF